MASLRQLKTFQGDKAIKLELRTQKFTGDKSIKIYQKLITLIQNRGNRNSFSYRHCCFCLFDIRFTYLKIEKEKLLKY